MTTTWPASRLERAQHVARGLLGELRDVAPTRASQLEAQLVAAGEGWIAPQRDVNAPGAIVSVHDAARLLGVARGTVWAWCSADDVPVHRYPGGVLLEECRQHQADVAERARRRKP